MKFKGTISTFMHKFFCIVAVIGFCILGSATDISEGGLIPFLWCWVGWLVCVALAVLFYDYRIFTRHFFAIYCVICLIHGYLHKIRDRKHRYLYNKFIEARTLSGFYESMICRYDFVQSRGE